MTRGELLHNKTLFVIFYFLSTTFQWNFLCLRCKNIQDITGYNCALQTPSNSMPIIPANCLNLTTHCFCTEFQYPLPPRPFHHPDRLSSAASA